MSCIFVYINDILVFSESEEQHFRDLKKVLSIFEENNPQISVDKVTINVFSYNVNTGEMNQHHKFSEPADAKSLRRFLGMENFPGK